MVGSCRGLPWQRGENRPTACDRAGVGSWFVAFPLPSTCYPRPLSFVVDSMKRTILALLGLAGAAGLMLVVMHQVGAASPVYTVTELRTSLTQDPRAWVGHVVLVRGTVTGCGFGLPCPLVMAAVRCATRGPCPPIGLPGMMLVDQPTISRLGGLPVQLGAENPQLAVLRRLPLLGRVVPPPQVVHWGIPAVYRVQLQPTQRSVCGSAPCYAAVLEDAAPIVPMIRMVVPMPSTRPPPVPLRPAPIVIHGAASTALPRPPGR
jgi:hypothetical protein